MHLAADFSLENESEESEETFVPSCKRENDHLAADRLVYLTKMILRDQPNDVDYIALLRSAYPLMIHNKNCIGRVNWHFPLSATCQLFKLTSEESDNVNVYSSSPPRREVIRIIGPLKMIVNEIVIIEENDSKQVAYGSIAATAREASNMASKILHSTQAKSTLVVLADRILQLLVFTDDWPRAAQHHPELNTLVEQRKKLADLLIDWRKQQLRTWLRILDTMRDNLHNDCILAAAPLLRAAFDTDSSKCDQLLSMVLRWCRAATVGDFDARLVTIRIVANFVADSSLSSKLTALAKHFEHCYKETIDRRYAHSIKPYKKQLNDLVRISTYEITTTGKTQNAHAIREVSRKAHKQLYRIMRQYRDSVADMCLVSVYNQPVEKDISFWYPTIRPLELIVLEQTVNHDRILRLNEIMKITSQKLKVLSERHADILNVLLDESKDVLGELRKLISYSTDDDDEKHRKQFGHAVQLRSRLVVSLLQKLHTELHLSANKGAKVNTESLTSIVMTDIRLSARPMLHVAVQQRCAALAVADSNDKNLQQLRPLRNTLEHATKLSTDRTLKLAEIDAAMKNIEDKMTLLARATESNRQTTSIDAAVDGLTSINKDLKFAHDFIEHSLEVMRTTELEKYKHCGIELATFQKEINEHRLNCRHFIDEKVPPNIDWLPKIQSWAAFMKDRLMTLYNDACVDRSLALALYTFKNVCDALNRIQSNHLQNEDVKTDFSDSLLSSSIEEILLVAQSLYKDDISDSPSLTLINRVDQLLDVVIKHLHKVVLCDSDRLKINQLLQLARPVLQLMSDMHRIFEHECLAQTFLTSNMALIVHHLATNGLAAPPPQKEKEQSRDEKANMQDEPSGMAEGTEADAKDVTEEITDLSQIEGLKGDKQDQQDTEKGKESESDKKPIEMEEDFDAQLENLNLDDFEEDDEDESADNKDEPHQEQQMGDIEQDEGEKQLDPKLWDENEKLCDDSNELKQDQGGESAQEETGEMGARDENQIDAQQQDTTKAQEEENQSDEHLENVDTREPESMKTDEHPEMPQEPPNQIEEPDDLLPPLEGDDDPMSLGDNNEECDDDGNQIEATPDIPSPDNPIDENFTPPDDIEQLNDGTHVDEAEDKDENPIKDEAENHQTIPSETASNQPQTTSHGGAETDAQKELTSDTNAEMHTKSKDLKNEDATRSNEQLENGDADGRDGQPSSKHSSNAPIINSKEQGRKRRNDESLHKTLGDCKHARKGNIEETSNDQNDDNEGLNENADAYRHSENAEESHHQIQDSGTWQEAQQSIDTKPLEEIVINDEATEDLRQQLDETAPTSASDAYQETNVELMQSEQRDTRKEDWMIESSLTKSANDKSFFASNDFFTDAMITGNYDEFGNTNIASMSLTMHDTITASRLWGEACAMTNHLALELVETLRTILEPTKLGRLQGDYRTGRRLNMRRVMSYVASDYRRDRIWMRRTKPLQRQYQVMISVDNSQSMEQVAGTRRLCVDTLALLHQTMDKLDVGKLGVALFGETTRIVQSFDEPITQDTGTQNIVRHMTFGETSTHLDTMLNTICDYMCEQRSIASVQSSIPAQLVFIIGDGRNVDCRGRTVLLHALKKMKSIGVFVIYMILDEKSDNDSSILSMKKYVKDKTGLLTSAPYMATFPFEHYVVLRHCSHLPAVLGDSLRQWLTVTSGEK